MAAPNITPYANKYKFGRGRLAFNPLVNGIYQGFRPFGNCPGFEISVEGETFEHQSSEGGISETDFTVPLGVTRSATVTTDNLDQGNQALFVAGEQVTVTQAATPVTDEVIPSVNAGRFYQLGATAINPSGVRGVSSVAVRIKEGADAPARGNASAYVVGDFYVPAAANNHFYLCTVSGTSAGSPPTFETDGTDFADGTATFVDMGLIVVPSTADVNYRLDAGLALLSPTEDGAIAGANTKYSAAVSGAKLSLEVDYTPAANTRSQVRTGGEQSVTGQLKFIADNPTGENDDLFCPQVTLTPNGALPYITGDDIGSVEFSVGIGVLNSQTRAIYIDGRPAGL
jgi:hypothetical protein